MKKWKLIGVVLLMAGILLRANDAVAGAQRAMRVWISSVAPSLFPFLVLMPLLTGAEACSVYGKLFARMMRPLFRLPGQAAPAVAISMITGSPGGAIAIRQIAMESGMKRGQAWRAALSCCGVSPAFLITGVGRGMFSSTALGIELAMAQLFTQLLFLFILRFFFNEENECIEGRQEISSGSGVTAAVEQILGICGYMVFFSSAAAMISGLIGREWGNACLLLMDLPSGLAALAQTGTPWARFALGASVGMGGMCIAAQNMEKLRAIDLPWGHYVAASIIKGAMMGIICMLKLPRFLPKITQSIVNPIGSYSFSLFCASFLILPALIYLSKNILLTKQSSEKMS